MPLFPHDRKGQCASVKPVSGDPITTLPSLQQIVLQPATMGRYARAALVVAGPRA